MQRTSTKYRLAAMLPQVADEMWVVTEGFEVLSQVHQQQLLLQQQNEQAAARSGVWVNPVGVQGVTLIDE